ncbi:MAG: FadR/GntR family transcriptional regulator [Armatimonadota bacterium]|nr:FadR/GntR family transcriptional regulator [Armatimonadota bacterium]MDR5702962.1 FadR/GntR family transcriptional regulator [Armatimonadota bacterium]MDR7434803.1 FadR/GntR family transcriptional regulator [Armatimonadota bacterium]
MGERLTTIPFQKIATKRKSLQVAEQILEAIRSGVYRPGDRLPPERVIAEQMGVSRPSIREALSALQLAGIVESRAGDGTYVTRVPGSHEETTNALSLLEKSASPVELLEARRILETAIVQAAVEKLTPESLAQIQKALGKMRSAADRRDYDAFSRANITFHLAIVRACHNPLLERAVTPLLTGMRQQLALEFRRRAYAPNSPFFERAYKLHANLLEAIASGEPEAAARAMRHHFEAIEESIRGE